MIHKYKLDEFNIVLHTESGAVHLFDDLAFALLDWLSDSEKPPAEVYARLASGTPSEIDECWDELRLLAGSGQLGDDAEDFVPAALSAEMPIKSLCLNITHDCNMSCEYCFAAEGTYGGKRDRMDCATAKNAIDFLIAHSANRHNLEVDFFGGEPLMNFDVVKECVSYARGREKECNKKFRFTLTTNGLLLDEAAADYLNREMSNVVLSLDGRKSVNDAVRRCKNGSGTHDMILPAFRRFREMRGERDYYIRGTYTSRNLDFADDVKHLYESGFDQISIEPVVAPQEADYSIKKEHLPTIFAEYERLARYIIDDRRRGGFFNFFHFMIDLEGGPCAVKRIKGCGCGNEYIAVAPGGDIYPCHQFVGLDGMAMGNVNSGSLDKDMKKRFAEASIAKKAECRSCWAKYYCSGGCNANNHIYNNDINAPYAISCEITKKRIECALMIKAALAAEELD